MYPKLKLLKDHPKVLGEELIEVDMEKEKGAQPIFISASLLTGYKTTILVLLREYIYVYAWTHEDMLRSSKSQIDLSSEKELGQLS